MWFTSNGNVMAREDASIIQLSYYHRFDQVKLCIMVDQWDRYALAILKDSGRPDAVPLFR